MPPDGVIQRTGGLVGGSESQHVEAVHLPTQGGQAWSGAAPMAAGGPEAMQQQQAWTIKRSDDTPVTAMTTPSPDPLVTPIGSLVNSGDHSPEFSGIPLSRRRCRSDAGVGLLSRGVPTGPGSLGVAGTVAAPPGCGAAALAGSDGRLRYPGCAMGVGNLRMRQRAGASSRQ